MADETREVRYDFTGDVSSLDKAVNEAIGDLDKYQKKINDLPHQKAAIQAQQMSDAIRESLKPLNATINTLKQKFSNLMLNKAFSGTTEARNLKTAMSSLNNQINSLNSKTTVTQNDFNKLSQAVDNVRNSFTAAGPSVDIFIQKEERFQQQLDAISNKSNEMAGRIKNAFSKLHPDISGITSKLESFKAKASEVMDHTRRIIEAAGSGFRQFKGDADAADSAHKGLFSSVSKLATGIVEEVRGIKKESESLKNKNSILSASNVKHLALNLGVKALSKTLEIEVGLINNVSKAFLKLVPSISKIKKESGLLSKVIDLLISKKLGTFLSEITKKSISFIENQNLFTVAMGDSVEEADKFLNKMSEIYGMDLSSLYRYSGYFYQLTDAVGTATEASKIMSLSLTKAANDISSLFNVNIEQVVKDIAAGIQGQSRTVRKYGMDIRSATLAQTALNYGFKENVYTTSEANREALRYLTMMSQVKNATKQVTTSIDGANTVIGDFARNIETPANQLRILKEQAAEVARAFGNFFIPIMQKTLYVVNGVLMAIKLLLQFLASLAGIDIDLFGGEVSKSAEDATGAIGGIGDAADKSAKKLKNLIAPFDELTILTQNNDTADGGIAGVGEGLDPALLEAIKNMSLDLDEIRMKALDVRDKILELLGLSLEDGELKVTIGGFVDDLINLWNNADYTGFGRRIAEFINQGVAWGIANTDPSIWSPILNEKISILAQTLNGLVADLNWEGLGTILGNGITIALGAINTFLTGFDWVTLGTQFANGLMGIANAIDWDLLGETIANYFRYKVETKLAFWRNIDWSVLGQDLANALNSLVTNFPWEEYGQLWAERFNGIFDAIGSFVENFDWISLGIKLSDGILSFINSTNWEKNGESLGKLIHGLIDSIHEFLANYEWGTLGRALGDFIQGMLREASWSDIINILVEILNGIVIEISAFLRNMDLTGLLSALIQGLTKLLSVLWSELLRIVRSINWGEILTQILSSLVYLITDIIGGLGLLLVDALRGIGNMIVQGLQSGIVNAMRNVGQWLRSILVDPIINAVKDLFGIHSPSRVFAEIGGYLVEGLFQGIKDMMSGAYNFVKQYIFDPLFNGLKKAAGWVGNKAQKFWDIGKGFITAIKDGLNGDPTAFTNWAKGAVQDIKDSLNPKEVENKAKEIPKAIKNGLANTKDVVGEVVNSMDNFKWSIDSAVITATDDFQRFKNEGISCFDSLDSRVQEFILSFTGKAQEIAEGVAGVVDSAVNAVSGLVDKLTGASDAADKAVTSATKAADAVSKITTTTTMPKTSLQTQTVNSLSKTATSTAIKKPNIGNISAAIKNTLTISKPRLATGGVVRRPTEALIGEGRYPEAVVPLGNSPELESMVNKIASAVSTTQNNISKDTPVIVNVYIDGEEITSHQNRINRMYGRTQQNL